MKTITRRSALATGLAATATLAAGPVRAQETFRFGLAMPLSGSQALYGADQVKAAVMPCEPCMKTLPVSASIAGAELA